MKSRLLLAAVMSFAAIAIQPVAARATFPQYSQLARHRAAGENPYYHVNRYGYGNYVEGPNGAIGGAGAVTFDDVVEHLHRFIADTYNGRRLHSSLYLSPKQFEDQLPRQAVKSAA